MPIGILTRHDIMSKLFAHLFAGVHDLGLGLCNYEQQNWFSTISPSQSKRYKRNKDCENSETHLGLEQFHLV